jgi:hypothetical protein
MEKRVMTIRTFPKAASKAAVLLVMTMTAGSALAQKIVAYSPGANYDQMSWQSFVSVVTPAPNGQQGLTLETWATDPDTF